MHSRVGAVENDLALAVRQHRIGQHEDAFGIRRQAFRRVVEEPGRVDVQAFADQVLVPAGEKQVICAS